MRTLSFDLRGFGADAASAPTQRTRGAGVSLLVHAAGISALTLVPLLGVTTPPETADALQAPLVRPVTISLPPAPRPAAPAPRGSTRPRTADPVARDITPPTNVPSMIRLGDVLDQGPGIPSNDRTGTGDSNGDTAAGGNCVLGALCGAGLDPAPTATPSTILHVGGLIREPRLLESRAPQYPPIARTAGVSGKVVMEAHVGRNGRILDIQIVEGHPLFTEAAVASVSSRRYEPLLLNGVPTEFLVTITINFSSRRPAD